MKRATSGALVAAATLAFGLLFVALGLRQMRALRIGSNSGSYLQSALSFAHHLNTWNYGDRAFETAHHDQWMLLALLPFAVAWPHLETVVVVQVAAIAASAPLLWRYALALGATPAAAALLALAWLLSPSLEGFAYGDFTPLHFVPALAFGFAWAVRAERRWLALALAQALCGVKEDVVLLLMWTCALTLGRRDRRLTVAIAGLGILNLAGYALYERLHGYATVTPGYGWFDPHPLEHVAFLLEVLAPLAFAPLLNGWRVVVALPFLAELFLAHGYAEGLLARSGSYYTIPFVTLLGLGAAHAIARVPQLARYALGLSALCALTLNPTVLRFGRQLPSADPLYPVARAWGDVDRPVTFPCEDQGAWVVAASNPQAQLVGCFPPEPATRPARPAFRDVPLGATAAWTRGPAP
jgi:uncharacterized membrane protein